MPKQPAIPKDMRDEIRSWRTSGMSDTAILGKLQKDRGITASRRALEWAIGTRGRPKVDVKRVTVRVSDDDRDRLQDLAAKYGLTVASGYAETDDGSFELGSISLLLRAIAAGQYVVLPADHPAVIDASKYPDGWNG